MHRKIGIDGILDPRGDQRARRLPHAAEDGLLDAHGVERRAEGVAHAGVVEGLLGRVEPHVGGGGQGLALQDQGLVLLDARDVVVDHGVGDVHLAGLESDRARRRLRDGAEHEGLELRLLVPVVVEALQSVPVALLPAHELEGAGADRRAGGRAVVLALGLDLLLVDDGAPAVGQGGEEGEVHLLEVQDDRVVVHDLDVVQVLGIGFDVGPHLRGGAFQRELDVLRLQILAVVELHALAEVHLVRRVGDELPLLGQAGAEGAVVVQEDEGVVDLMTGAGTGIIVVTDGIEHGRVILVGHNQRVLGGERGTAEGKNKRKCQQCQNALPQNYPLLFSSSPRDRGDGKRKQKTCGDYDYGLLGMYLML